MLKVILNPASYYRIYLDIKDTRSAGKIRKLHEVLANEMYDFKRSIIQQVQTVRSNEVEQLQLADLLIGALAYVYRGLVSSRAKLDLVERIKVRSNYKLTQTTLLQEEKVNLFRWRAS